MNKSHSPFFKPCPYAHVDIFRVLELFQVTDPALAHAAKKILAASKRTAEQTAIDVQHAIDALVRWQEMRHEEEFAAAPRAGRRPGDPLVVPPRTGETPGLIPPKPGETPPPALPSMPPLPPHPQRRATDLVNAGLIVRRAAKNAISDDEAT